jgi:colanic acid biosynthesis glycosyl transferase WcaI
MREHLAVKGVKPERLSIVRNWVDFEKIRPLDHPSVYRGMLNLGSDAFVALYAGNIGAKQGLEVMLDAARRLEGEVNLVFVVAGDGPWKSRLVARYGALRNVRFLPVQPEDQLCELLNLANIHILPQERSAADLVLPSKLGGMLASGRPCVVMADPGTELYEFLGESVVFVPPGDVGALAERLRSAYRDPTGCRVMSTALDLSSLTAARNLPNFKAILNGTAETVGRTLEISRSHG